MPVAWVDTHVHLDDEAFAGAEEQVVARAHEAGVTRLVAVATTEASCGKVVALAKRFPGVAAAVGIQPNYVAEASPNACETVARLAASCEQVVAIGETGIDHYWDYAPRDLQEAFFQRHLEIARRLDLPVIIHMRESGEAIVEAVRRFTHAHGPVHGVMHSFTGDEALLSQCLDLGLFISFAGMVTFRKSDELREVVRSVPGDRLLLETDAPYLSPEPVRGKRPNEPARLVHTAACVAEVRGMSLEELAEITTANAERLFGLPAPPARPVPPE